MADVLCQGVPQHSGLQRTTAIEEDRERDTQGMRSAYRSVEVRLEPLDAPLQVGGVVLVEVVVLLDDRDQLRLDRCVPTEAGAGAGWRLGLGLGFAVRVRLT